jgi:hypothetical protein
MKYKNVSLPYPVLGIYDDIYPLLEDDCIQMADPVKTATEYQFRIILKQQNKDISQLVSCGKAEYACEVTCRSTFLRRCYKPEFGISDCRFSCYARFPIGAYYICPPNNMDGKMQEL